MGISRELKITMNRLGGLILLFTFIVYTKCETFTEGDCFYRCDADGSCKVNWNGSFRPGGTEASCFSPQFGGSCFGKVNGCKDCNQICGGGGSGSSGGSSSSSGPCGPFTGQLPPGASRCELVRNSAGKCERACVGFAVQAEPEDSGSSGGSSRPSGGSSSGGSKSDRNCRYQCQNNGGCEVTYIGPSRPGQLSGSCFPKSFGGSCSGTPRECQDCSRALNC